MAETDNLNKGIVETENITVDQPSNSEKTKSLTELLDPTKRLVSTTLKQTLSPEEEIQLQKIDDRIPSLGKAAEQFKNIQLPQIAQNIQSKQITTQTEFLIYLEQNTVLPQICKAANLLATQINSLPRYGTTITFHDLRATMENIDKIIHKSSDYLSDSEVMRADLGKTLNTYWDNLKSKQYIIREP